jgi:uncharacterized protein YcfL
MGVDIMKKVLLGFLLVLLLAGCNSKLSYSETDLESVEKDVQDFVLSVSDTNGVYLYFNGTKKAYVFLNGVNKEEGELFFKHFHVEAVGNMLDISYSQEENIEATDKSFKNQMLYEINKDKDYVKIQLFKNGEKIPFDSISGN